MKSVDVDKIVFLYKSGLSHNSIAKIMGIGYWVVANRLHRANIKMRPNTCGSGKRKYEINEKALDRLTPKVCWVLGWLMGDGWTDGKNLLALRASVKDEDILNKMKDFFGYGGPIYWQDQYLKKTNKYYRIGTLKLSSAKLVGRLLDFEIIPRKSQHEVYPLKLLDVDNELFHSCFIRGMLESDGTVSSKDKQALFQIVGTKEVLTTIQDLLIRFVGVRKTKIHCHKRSENHWMLRYRGNKQVPRILLWIYKEHENNVLTRKYKIAKEIMK